MSKIIFFDSTLRDGSHAIKHQLTKENIKEYCAAIDDAGMEVVIVGHGYGLGASTLQAGFSLLEDYEMLCLAKQYLKKTKLGVFVAPGFATIKNNIKPAIKLGVDVFCVAAHCTEADITQQHIEFINKNNKEVYGVLMMYHMTSKEKLLEEAQKMQKYGVKGIVIMDSAGASTLEMIEETVEYLVDNLNISVGFHPHNNLGLGVVGAYIAIKNGATIIDGTLRGFGAGAGNCQLEALIALLKKRKYKLSVNLYKILDISENIVSRFTNKDKGISSLSIISGMNAVVSTFGPPVLSASKKFEVDSRDIFEELGKRKVVACQEDVIIEVAEKLQRLRKEQNSDLAEIESLF